MFTIERLTRKQERGTLIAQFESQEDAETFLRTLWHDTQLGGMEDATIYNLSDRVSYIITGADLVFPHNG